MRDFLVDGRWNFRVLEYTKVEAELSANFCTSVKA